MNQDELKQAVGRRAAQYIEPLLTKESVVGVGTGSTANCFIEALADSKHKFDGAVASSEATAGLLREAGIAVYDLNDVNEMLVYVDGADELSLTSQKSLSALLMTANWSTSWADFHYPLR